MTAQTPARRNPAPHRERRAPHVRSVRTLPPREPQRVAVPTSHVRLAVAAGAGAGAAVGIIYGVLSALAYVVTWIQTHLIAAAAVGILIAVAIIKLWRRKPTSGTWEGSGTWKADR